MAAVVAAHTFLNPNSRSTSLFLRTPRCLPYFPQSVNPGRNRVSHSVLKDRKEVVSEEDGHSKGEESPSLVIEYEEKGGNDGFDKVIGRGINAAIVLGVGSLTVTRLPTIDHEYWHGWTLFEILRYAPEHNLSAYEEALKTNPVLAKMAISGVVYSIGDWIVQCYEGKPLFEFDRQRVFRSGLMGFTFDGSLSHYYYQFCEALFPFQDWWVVPAKVAFDQTVWAAIWNNLYFVILGFLQLEEPYKFFSELKATFWPMLTAGWKLWPFAHLITYGVIPVDHQRLLWVDCVELIWVTILSTNEGTQEKRIVDNTLTPLVCRHAQTDKWLKCRSVIQKKPFV